VIRPRLFELDHFLRRHSGRATPGKALVDTGPVLERDWAQQAGIGFTGKNCCTIHPTDGSWLLLATLLVPETLDYDLPPLVVQSADAPPRAVAAGLPPAAAYGAWQFFPDKTKRSVVGTCGRCTRCLDACPTNAFVGPYHLNPERCISYWTIEARSAIPYELRSHFGNRIFGCDICQEVCPWNRRLATRTPLLAGLAAQGSRVAPPLLEGFAPATPYWLDETAFRQRFRNSPILRAKRQGMLRNVCVALGNWADHASIPALVQALADCEALGRGHAAWALGQVLRRHDDVRAKVALTTALAAEVEPWVRAEIEEALKL
jgi:epoxyqueuosine reductase